MVSNRITEGVGKKIVEALKMQSDIEIQHKEDNISEQPVSDISQETSEQTNIEFVNSSESITNINEDYQHQNTLDNNFSEINNSSLKFEQPVIQNVTSFNQIQTPENDYNSLDIDDFEIPANVAVLRQLINQLPSGVSKQTGAQIIKQTMEALGISMKSVLQEAQQVQENLNSSTRECQASIMEYKKQIGIMEKQVQKFQKQYAALNDIISLFIQTNI